MADPKSNKLKARLPRGLADRAPAEIAATRRMMETIRQVYELYGFEPVETPAIEYTDALGKFLPDQDRPNEGVFSFQDDDEQWLSLRYDLTAPLARYVAENFDQLPKPYRSYRAGYVYRNEKPGPGRFRQFMQFDADTVGSASTAADAEICMMAADAMEALGVPRGSYVVKVNNRKVLDGVLEAIGLGGEANAGKRLTVLRAIDKLDRLGPRDVMLLLGAGRKDESGDFTRGAGLTDVEAKFVLAIVGFGQNGRISSTAELPDLDELKPAFVTLNQNFEATASGRDGARELREIERLIDRAGYQGRIVIDRSVVRGLEYYTGPVYEIELTFPTSGGDGAPVRFGSVGGGGRYDGLVSRFRGEPVPATGFSIGVSRLLAALTHLGKIDAKAEPGPVIVTVMDREPTRLADYQRMAATLRSGGIRAELYLGSGKFGPQMKYADRRRSPCVVIQGADEKQKGEVQIKDLIVGAELAGLSKERDDYLKKQAEAQFAVSEEKLVDAVREVLARHVAGIARTTSSDAEKAEAADEGTEGKEKRASEHIQNQQKENSTPDLLPWARASLADLADVDFEAPLTGSQSADSTELSELFRAAVGPRAENGELPNTPGARVFNMLEAVTGMHFKPQEPNEPFGAMYIFQGRRSALPTDFLGPPIEVLAGMAARAANPVLRARLADVCWFLQRRRGQLAATAADAYVEIVKKVDGGQFKFRFDENSDVLSFEARDLLRRALLIGNAIGREKSGPLAARNLVVDLRKRSFEKLLPIPSLWFAHLDLDFGISEPAEVGKDVETLINRLPIGTDSHTTVDLWRLAARAYRLGKSDDDQYRCQSAAAEQLVIMAEQPSAMLASHSLAEAIAELRGVPGKKERRKELRHRLVDSQAGISDEMSVFSHPINLDEIAEHVEQQMRRPNLRDKLFTFAALTRSPDPTELSAHAEKSIREHPLSALIGASHHDREGKVVHRSEGAGVGQDADSSVVQRQIAQDEGIRRHITASGEIDVARLAITRDHYISEETLAQLLARSPFVPQDLVMTYSRGFARFFQGDFISGLYILTPLLENSLRHVLKSHGHEVTKFNDAKKTQEDRTISSLFEQMRTELVSVFGDAIVTDIENVFLKKPGPYLRHGLSHGLLHDGDPYGDDAIYACWLIFHLCMLPLFPIRTLLTLPFDATKDVATAPT